MYSKNFFHQSRSENFLARALASGEGRSLLAGVFCLLIFLAPARAEEMVIEPMGQLSRKVIERRDLIPNRANEIPRTQLKLEVVVLEDGSQYLSGSYTPPPGADPEKIYYEVDLLVGVYSAIRLDPGGLESQPLAIAAEPVGPDDGIFDPLGLVCYRVTATVKAETFFGELLNSTSSRVAWSYDATSRCVEPLTTQAWCTWAFPWEVFDCIRETDFDGDKEIVNEGVGIFKEIPPPEAMTERVIVNVYESSYTILWDYIDTDFFVFGSLINSGRELINCPGSV